MNGHLFTFRLRQNGTLDDNTVTLYCAHRGKPNNMRFITWKLGLLRNVGGSPLTNHFVTYQSGHGAERQLYFVHNYYILHFSQYI